MSGAEYARAMLHEQGLKPRLEGQSEDGRIGGHDKGLKVQAPHYQSDAGHKGQGADRQIPHHQSEG